jgi:4a-hydroxytetrahydrobiopterin dehydratase
MSESQTAGAPGNWEQRGKPPTLFRRFAFQRYSETRAFLDALAELSEASGLHPQNINFASTYVNVTLEAGQNGELGEAEFNMAARINALYEGLPGG